VAEKQTDSKQRAIRLEYRFDRLSAEKLAQAYELLVPERRGLADCTPAKCREILNDQDGSDATLKTGWWNHTSSGTFAARECSKLPFAFRGSGSPQEGGKSGLSPP
jgi:hypothetical protein